jgi:large subunit ribosomal protein L22
MATKESMKATLRAEERETGPARASLRNIQLSSRKARATADLIRGQLVGDALTSLAFQQRKAAKPMMKLLDSAIANAVQRGMNVDKLRVAEIQVHQGPIVKRFLPRAHGRATPIRKNTAHIDLGLMEVGK